MTGITLLLTALLGQTSPLSLDRAPQADALPSARVRHFEIPADDPERAAAFYREALGWRISRWDGPLEYWEVTTGPDVEPGINGGLIRRRRPGSHPVSVAYVASVAETLRRVERAGGSVIIDKTAVPGVGWEAYLLDTEGNGFAVFQPDPAAK